MPSYHEPPVKEQSQLRANDGASQHNIPQTSLVKVKEAEEDPSVEDIVVQGKEAAEDLSVEDIVTAVERLNEADLEILMRRLAAMRTNKTTDAAATMDDSVHLEK